MRHRRNLAEFDQRGGRFTETDSGDDAGVAAKGRERLRLIWMFQLIVRVRAPWACTYVPSPMS